MNWKKKLTSCTLVIGISTLIIYIINKFIYFAATINNLFDQVKGEFYDWRFGKIFYKKQGYGSPILLIHDLSSQSSSCEWNKIVEQLSKTNTVYSIDLLGCGKSDKPCITYTNYLYVQLITDFIKNVVHSKVDIISTGESNPFVIMASKNDDTIINRIIMVNPLDISYLSLMPTRKTKILKMLINAPIIGTLLYNMIHTKAYIEDLFYDEYFSNSSKVDDNDIKTYYESAHKENSKGKYLFASMKSCYINTNMIPGLKELTNSIFIIVGDGTPNNMTIAQQYVHFLPSIEIVGIDKTNKLPQMEAPDQFIEQVKILFEL